MPGKDEREGVRKVGKSFITRSKFEPSEKEGKEKYLI